MPIPYFYRDTPTAYGGIVRIFPDGSSQIIKRDFGLTHEPECSEEAHKQILKWWQESIGFIAGFEWSTPSPPNP
jgi:hypothetical protein